MNGQSMKFIAFDYHRDAHTIFLLSFDLCKILYVKNDISVSFKMGILPHMHDAKHVAPEAKRPPRVSYPKLEFVLKYYSKLVSVCFSFKASQDPQYIWFSLTKYLRTTPYLLTKHRLPSSKVSEWRFLVTCLTVKWRFTVPAATSNLQTYKL